MDPEKLLARLFPVWLRLAVGEVLLVRAEAVQRCRGVDWRDQRDQSPDVLAVLWSARSTDALVAFIDEMPEKERRAFESTDEFLSVFGRYWRTLSFPAPLYGDPRERHLIGSPH